MSVLEFEEKTVEDAIAVACQELKLPREQLEIEIVSKGSSGIFGIVGAKKAKIRVAPKALSLEGAAERGKEILTEILRHVDLPTVIESEVKRRSSLPEYYQQRHRSAHWKTRQNPGRTAAPCQRRFCTEKWVKM